MGNVPPLEATSHTPNSAYSQEPNVYGTTTFGVIFLAIPLPTAILIRLSGWYGDGLAGRPVEQPSVEGDFLPLLLSQWPSGPRSLPHR